MVLWALLLINQHSGCLVAEPRRRVVMDMISSFRKVSNNGTTPAPALETTTTVVEEGPLTTTRLPELGTTTEGMEDHETNGTTPTPH